MRYQLRTLLIRLAAGPPLLEFLQSSWQRSQQGLGTHTQRNLWTIFRFSIRDVLWLMVVVGLGVGWWNDQRRVEVEADRSKRTSIAYQSKLEQISRERREELERRAEAASPLPIMMP